MTLLWAQDATTNNTDTQTSADAALQMVDSITATEGAIEAISIWGLVMQADLVVKFVMLLLLASSIFTWAVIFEKIRLFRQLSALSDDFEHAFWSGENLNILFEKLQNTPQDPMTALFLVGMREWKESRENGTDNNKPPNAEFLQFRIERQMGLQINKELNHIEKNFSMLATIGSAAPFIGLFGTVWGIMNSFIAISATKQTNLSVVAPGIAEALFATALGLAAAIPATVAFNKLSYLSNRYANRMQGFIDEFVILVSRELDKK